MGLPFFNKKSRKSDHIVAIDLGSRATKAVYLQRHSGGFNLAGLAILEAPGLGEKEASPELLAEHLKCVFDQLGAKSKQIILAVGVQESLLRLTELPMLPVTEMRTMLKYGSKNYLKEELNGHVFDCHALPLRQMPTGDPEKKTRPGSVKQPVVVGGMPEQRLIDLVSAVKLAGLTLEAVVPGHIGPANAFELTDTEAFHNEVIALVEVGFKNSCISILNSGELVLNRVVNVGGDKLTNGLAETLSISYEEAEGIKIGMPNEVQSTLESLLLPLGRELRASADFFENQNEKPVTQILVSGGCACSEFLAQMLQNELMSPCKNWNPTGFLNNSLPPEQQEQFEPNIARLSVAIGAATTAF